MSVLRRLCGHGKGDVGNPWRRNEEDSVEGTVSKQLGRRSAKGVRMEDNILLGIHDERLKSSGCLSTEEALLKLMGSGDGSWDGRKLGG